MKLLSTLIAVACACTALGIAAHEAPATQAQSAQPLTAKPELDKHTQQDIERHQGMAQAHAQAAQCLASGESMDKCQKQLQASCKGLALGKNCGMRHAH